MHLIKNFQYILAAIPLIVINCSPPDQRLFDDIDEQETVIIYLNKYHLDGVPREIGKLRRAKSLSVM